MLLRLIREPSRGGATLGSLYVDGTWECWTLEDQIRDAKVPGQTAIPAGDYEVRLTTSPKFGRVLPEVLQVPGFVGIRIHGGNRKEDTDGCILVGQQRGPAWIGQSQLALSALMAKMIDAPAIRLRIDNPQQ